MLAKQRRTSSGDWHGFYTQKVVEDCGMSPTGTFIYVGMGVEPQYEWNDQEKSYTDEIISQGLWCAQNYVDKATGEHFMQNPVLIRVEGSKVPQIQFGQEVEFQGLLGYYSRKARHYSFRADGVKVVKHVE